MDDKRVQGMTWFRVEQDLPDNPKIAQAGTTAAWLYVCGIAYCSRNLTDGFIPAVVAHRLTIFDNPEETCEQSAHKLCLTGLWEQVIGGYSVANYLKWQPSKAEIEAKREAARERMTVFRRSSREQTENFARSSPEVRELDVDVDVEEPKSKAKTAVSAEVQEVYDHWRAALGKSDPRYDNMSERRAKTIQSRLSEGFSVAELVQALDAVAADDWADRSKHSDLDVIFRRRESVEKWLEGSSEGATLYRIASPGETF